MTTLPDPKAIRGMSPGQRKELKKSLASAEKGAKKSRKGPGLGFLFVYGLLCAGLGAYVKDSFPTVQVWLGRHVQNIGGFGQEQAIRGFLAQSGLSREEQEKAMADVKSAYERKRSGQMNERELARFSAAERPFELASAGGREPNAKEIQTSLALFTELAGR